MSQRPNIQYDLWNSLKFNLISGCWEYSGNRDRDGYGRFSWATGYLRAHRAAWIFTFGDIPDGMEVCHTCDNPPCCNPAHLWLGTTAENQTDCKDKGRTRSGSRNGRALLLEEDIPVIRRRIASGQSLSSIGRDYCVGPSVIWRIKSGSTWGHVPSQIGAPA